MKANTDIPAGPLLAVRNLRKFFPVRRGFFSKRIGFVKAVDRISFDVWKGQTLGIVGESGCGKTTTARLLLRLEEADAGEVLFEGRNILADKGRGLKGLRRQIQMVFQDPYSSLDPRKTVRKIVGEPLRVHRLVARGELEYRVVELLRRVGLRPDHLDRYPHEFSGGERQRIGIARALAPEPKLVVCDEPVSALDVSIRSQILNLLLELQEAFHFTCIFIAHDLTVVEHISDWVVVMYLGKIAERAPTEEFYSNPLHPYSEALLSATPVVEPLERKARIILRGDVPSSMDPPSGCYFRTRCPLAREVCAREEPALKGSSSTHPVACHFRG